MSSLELTKEEKLVYDCIRNANGKITQAQIARLEPNLGSHKKHEGYISDASTLRKIRAIVRDLVMKHGLFILSDGDGSFFNWFRNRYYKVY